MQRLYATCLLLATIIAASRALAHGPQIQTTLVDGQIFTRRIVPASDYATALTAPTSVYVMPLVHHADGVWRAQPDSSKTLGDFNYIGWPGFAYGYGYDATTNPEPFPAGSQFSLEFVNGLKLWDGGAFVDAGDTEAESYRGSSVTPSDLARTSDAAPYQGIMFPGIDGISFASSGSDVHNSVHYRMLGDGASLTSDLADGVFLLSFALGSTDSSVAASDPFHFVLTKNADAGAVQAAVESLGFDAGAVQFIPEPSSTLGLGVVAAAGLASGARRRRVRMGAHFS